MIASRQYYVVPAPQGRPMLMWDGKRSLHRVKIPSIRLSEVHGGPNRANSETMLTSLVFHGDNKAVLAYLLTHEYRGKVKLVYIDPPYDTGLDFFRPVIPRGPGLSRVLASGETELGRQVQYLDSWSSDTYLQFMYERLLLLRDILSENGSIWLHCDYRRSHFLRLLLDEVFGAENYLNTISWRSQIARGAKVDAFYFPYSTHYIEVYARNRAAPTTWNPVRKQIVMSEAEAAVQFMHDTHGYFRTSDPGTYSFESLKELHTRGRIYAPYHGNVVVDEEHRRVYASNGGNIGVKYYLTDLGKGRYSVERGVDNLWDDIPGLGTTPGEDLGYPTQKTEALLRRVISVSTNPGDLVLDCFSGSGTTCAVAQKMGRTWIACDSNPGAIQTMVRRLYWEVHPQASDVQPSRRTPRRRSRKSESERSCVLASGHEVHVYATLIAQATNVVADYPTAQVRCERCIEPANHIRVQILEYASPSIAALSQRSDALNDGAEDWRRLIDSIMIDANYDGEVLRVQLCDAPRRKSDLVKGEYCVRVVQAVQLVAVKITNILGEELLLTRKV